MARPKGMNKATDLAGQIRSVSSATLQSAGVFCEVGSRTATGNLLKQMWIQWTKTGHETSWNQPELCPFPTGCLINRGIHPLSPPAKWIPAIPIHSPSTSLGPPSRGTHVAWTPLKEMKVDLDQPGWKIEITMIFPLFSNNIPIITFNTTQGIFGPRIWPTTSPSCACRKLCTNLPRGEMLPQIPRMKWC